MRKAVPGWPGLIGSLRPAPQTDVGDTEALGASATSSTHQDSPCPPFSEALRQGGRWRGGVATRSDGSIGASARLTAREGLRQDLGREGGLGAGVVTLVLKKLLPQNVAPAAVEKAVQNVGRDDFGQRQPGRLQPGLEHQGLSREHGAHHGQPGFGGWVLGEG